MQDDPLEELVQPKFDDLPKHPILNLSCSWDVWPADDDLGTINRITARSVQRAVKEVRTGLRYNLSLPLDLPNPPMYSRQSLRHHVFKLNRNTYDDYVDGLYLQGSSQWDSLLHIRAGEHGLYKGRQLEPEEYVANGGAGLEAWVNHGIVARGVLLDVASYLEKIGTPVKVGVETRFDRQILEATASSQGVEFGSGDVLLIRTGWMNAYLSASGTKRDWFAGDVNIPGLHAEEDTARFLWDTGCAAVVADNPTLEASPGDSRIGSLHRRLIPMLGFAIGELWNLEPLAAAARTDGRYTCCVISSPLNLPAAIGSPANALAIK